MTTTTSAPALQHLYWRAGFGPRPQEVAAGLSPRRALRQLLHDSQTYEPLPSPLLAGPEIDEKRRADLTPELRKARNQQRQQQFQQLSLSWMTRMAASPAQLREKMTLFWHGHFACRGNDAAAALSLNNTLRRLALDKFPDLLLAVSREPAMLQFLNNQQNKKAHPNENFARELMELFTLGRGHYTEPDVKEAARAFTGWAYNRGADGTDGGFVFRAREHDNGPKTFLGQTGSFGGEDVLRIILAQPAAATFLVTKIYRFFVNDAAAPDPARIAALAASFRASGYDLSRLLEDIFSADWFYDPANQGTHIKSPVELVAGLRRGLALRFEQELPLLNYQKALGQTLFQPPNVAGWPGGRNWIDSSSLLLRLQLPATLLQKAAFDVQLKEDENDLKPQMDAADRTQAAARLGTRLPLAPLQALLDLTPTDAQPLALSHFLLQSPIRPENLVLVQTAASRETTPEARLRTTLLSLLSLPEYQLA